MVTVMYDIFNSTIRDSLMETHANPRIMCYICGTMVHFSKNSQRCSTPDLHVLAGRLDLIIDIIIINIILSSSFHEATKHEASKQTNL